MKKKYRCEVDCADCAAKLERAIAKLDGVEAVSVNFMTQKLILTAPDDRFDAVFAEVIRTAKRVEPDTVISA